jgi:hypothetical protein
MFQTKLLPFHCIILTSASLALIRPASGADADSSPAAPGDKSEYNLFNATPPSQMRPLALFANDGVIDPTTVDAGHFQVQGNLVNYYHYATTYADGVHFTEQEFAWSPRLSVGLLNNVDLFIQPGFYSNSRDYNYPDGFTFSENSSGYNGMTVGTKINLWGNDGGMTALAVEPFLSIPNGGNVLGGAAIPLAVRLPNKFYVKFMIDPYAFNGRHDSVNLGMEDSMSLHKMLGDKLDAYAYLDTIWLSNDTPWYGYSGFGVGYLLTTDFELYADIGFGLTSRSYDYNPRMGLAWRF